MCASTHSKHIYTRLTTEKFNCFCIQILVAQWFKAMVLYQIKVHFVIFIKEENQENLRKTSFSPIVEHIVLYSALIQEIALDDPDG